MEAKHTAGPWFRNIPADGKYPVIFSGRNTHVAVAQQMRSTQETEANIDLIAAAPELLAALRRLHEASEGESDEEIEARFDARKAIAKATGGVPQ
jgi:hypothetical protein